MRGIQIREELTDEWKNRGVTESKDFGILTAEICNARKDLELETGEKVITEENYLHLHKKEVAQIEEG